MPAHLDPDGRFQSDKYPTTPPDLVPLKVTDETAQDLLWEYASRRERVDAEFSEDLRHRLREVGFDPASVHAAQQNIDAATSQRDHARLRLRTIWNAVFRGTGSPDRTLGHVEAHLELARLHGHIADDPKPKRKPYDHS